MSTPLALLASAVLSLLTGTDGVCICSTLLLNLKPFLGFTVCVLVAAGLLVPLAHELARVTQKALGLGESRTVALQSPSWLAQVAALAIEEVLFVAASNALP